MTKAEQVKLKVRYDVWRIMREVYDIKDSIPQSERQSHLCDAIADYVAQKLAPNMTAKELEEVLK